MIWAPSAFSPDDGGIPATAQCTKPSASSSVTRRAISTVPAGGAVHTSSGERSSPWHVKRTSIGPPGAHGNWREKAWATVVVVSAVEVDTSSSGTPGRLVVVVVVVGTAARSSDVGARSSRPSPESHATSSGSDSDQRNSAGQ